ncbi:MAG: carbohydrate ABC transporter permease [Spirochaetales bacterium]|nr:carbohydrate ABC transporter permease [Spirochaetales bacterium]
MSFNRAIIKSLRRISVYFVAVFFAVIFLIPFYFMFILPTHNNQTIWTSPPPFWIGPHLNFTFVELVMKTKYLHSILNSILIALLATSTRIFFCTMAGFAFAKYVFPGRKLIFGIILATLMLPKFLTIVPFYSMMVYMGWINTYLPLVVPQMAFSFGIFLMAQYIKNLVPNALLDAAQIDGLNGFQTLLRVVFPVVQPAIGVLATVVFVESWNDFMTSLLVLPNEDMFTIPVAIRALTFRVDFGTVMLANVFAMAPLILLFVIFSKRIIANLVSGNIKG